MHHIQLAASSHLDDYVRYCASVSRAPCDPEDPSENAGETRRRTPAGIPANGVPASGRSGRGPPGILVIAVVVALEATALLVAAIWYGSQLLTGAPVLSFWGAVFTLCLLLAFSAWLFAVATLPVPRIPLAAGRCPGGAALRADHRLSHPDRRLSAGRTGHAGAGGARRSCCCSTSGSLRSPHGQPEPRPPCSRRPVQRPSRPACGAQPATESNRQLDRRRAAVGNDDGAPRRRTLLGFEPDPEQLTVHEPPRGDQDPPPLAARVLDQRNPLPDARAEAGGEDHPPAEAVQRSQPAVGFGRLQIEVVRQENRCRVQGARERAVVEPGPVPLRIGSRPGPEPAARRVQAREGSQQRALPGAGAAEDREDAAGRQLNARREEFVASDPEAQRGRDGGGTARTRREPDFGDRDQPGKGLDPERPGASAVGIARPGTAGGSGSNSCPT